MAMIHLYNAGEMDDPRRVGRMYPRPAPCPDDRFDKIDYIKYLGKAWISRTIDTCECTFQEALKEAKGTDCPSLEVGDLLGMVIAPSCMILDGVGYNVESGVEGITFDLVQAEVDCTDEGLNPVTISAIDASDNTPAYDPQQDPCIRTPLEVFCQECGGEGACGYFPNMGPVTVPGQQIDVSDAQDGSVLVTTADTEIMVPTKVMLQAPQYFYLKVTALPEDWDCTKCCLKITVSVGMDDPWQGN